MNKNPAIECVHFEKCSGCQLNFKIDDFPLSREMQEFFAQSYDLNVRLQLGKASGWRTRAKLAVRGNSKVPHIGLYKEGTHEVLDIPHCVVHHPRINEAVEWIRNWIVEESIEPYSENGRLGTLRYIQITVESESQNVQICFVFAKMSELIRKAIAAFFEKYREKTHSLWINLNDGANNVIFGSYWEKIAGKDWLHEKILHQAICFHPGSFRQANLEMFKKTVEDIRAWLPENANIVEYYAGVGSIGLSLLSKVNRWIGAEISEQSLPSFQATYALLSHEDQSKVSFQIGRAEQLLTLLDKGEIVIVDPPRKGLDPKMIAALSVHLGVQKIIYLSCGWKSFTNDAKKLTDAGWKVTQAKAYLYFPGTEHIETLALFERN